MKRFLGIVCFIYSGIIIYVSTSDLLKNFLAPTMQLYIKLSIVPLLLMGIVMIFFKHTHYKFKVSDLILLLPIVMLIFAGDLRLSSSIAQNRVLNVSSDRKQVEEDIQIKDEEEIVEEATYDFTDVDFNVVDASYYDLANYFTFISSANKYEGSTIRLRGFTLLDDTFIADGYFMLGKYNISCCAADAIFVGFYVKDFEGLKENTWYEIEGVLFSSVDGDGYETMAINPINIKEIDAKDEDQYVYPCYSYDEGLCKEVEKYDLSY